MYIMSLKKKNTMFCRDLIYNYGFKKLNNYELKYVV